MLNWWGAKIITNGCEPKLCTSSAEEVKEEMLAAATIPSKGDGRTRRWRQSSQVRFNFKKKQKHNTKHQENNTCTLMQRSHYIHISSFLPQSTGILSHFGVYNKRLKTFRLVLHRKTCSLNILHAFNSCFLETIKHPLREWIFSFDCFPLFQGTGKKIYLFRATQQAQAKAACELDWQKSA